MNKCMYIYMCISLVTHVKLVLRIQAYPVHTLYMLPCFLQNVNKFIYGYINWAVFSKTLQHSKYWERKEERKRGKKEGRKKERKKQKVVMSLKGHIKLLFLFIHFFLIVETTMGVKINAQENKETPFLVAMNILLNLVCKRLFQIWLQPDWLYRLLPQYRQFQHYLHKMHSFTDEVNLHLLNC